MAKKGIMMVMAGGPTPPRFGAKKMAESEVSERNNQQEAPRDEKAFHQQGASPKPTPESVNFRSAGEGCDSCEYNQSGQCAFLEIPVGLTCNRYENRAQDAVGPEGPEEASEMMA